MKVCVGHNWVIIVYMSSYQFIGELKGNEWEFHLLSSILDMTSGSLACLIWS